MKALTGLPSLRLQAAAFGLLLLLLSLTSQGGAESLVKGERVPLFEDIQRHIALDRDDRPTTGPILLLFIKDDDRYSRRAVEQIQTLRERNLELFKDAEFVLIRSRSGENGMEGDWSPPKWFRLLEDPDDALYTAYQIIATPTAAIASPAGNLLGHHPGYSPGLANSIQRDLVLALLGRTELRTPAPSTSPELVMGRRLAERGLPERALPYFRQAMEEEPLAEQDLLTMARLLIDLEEDDEALGLLRGLEDSDAANELIQELTAPESE